MKLRDYQQAAVDAVLRYWERGGLHPLVEVPTGGGKSAILGELARVVVQDCGGRVVIATHRAELIEQDAAACRRVWPQAPLAIWSASLGKRGTAAITVAGVQTVARRARDLGVVDVLIVDEAHLIPAEGDGQYQTLVRGLREASPGLRIVGLTATPYRLSQGYLTQGHGALFTSICYRVDVASLIAQGHLAPLVTGAVGAQIDVDALAVRAGEFAARDLELAADVAAVTERVADDVAAALDAGRTSALLFACSVAHAHHLAEAVQARGREAMVITGETDAMVRAGIIGRFRRRELACLVSCDVLTTGFDAPVVDVLAVVRATMSPSLYVQIVGRGMRPVEGKRDCLVLDYGGNIARHGPVDDVRIKPKSGKGGGEAPTKTCGNCAAEQPASARVCSECDAEFPPPEKKANAEASSLPVLSTGAIDGKRTTSTTHAVGDVQFHVHKKRTGDGPPTVRVDYYGAEPDGASSAWVPTKIASEWICVEHEGFAGSKASTWWARYVGTRIPATVAEAVERLKAGEMRRVVEIETKPDGDYTRVVRLVQEAGRQPGADDDEEALSNQDKRNLASMMIAEKVKQSGFIYIKEHIVERLFRGHGGYAAACKNANLSIEYAIVDSGGTHAIAFTPDAPPTLDGVVALLTNHGLTPAWVKWRGERVDLETGADDALAAVVSLPSLETVSWEAVAAALGVSVSTARRRLRSMEIVSQENLREMWINKLWSKLLDDVGEAPATTETEKLVDPFDGDDLPF